MTGSSGRIRIGYARSRRAICSAVSVSVAAPAFSRTWATREALGIANVSGRRVRKARATWRIVARSSSATASSPQALQGLLARAQRAPPGRIRREDLGDEEHLVPASLDGLPHYLLGSVHLRGVDVR